MEQACIRSDNLTAHWRRYTSDYNDFGFCHRCYDPSFDNAIDPECPVCYGTGFEKGYARPSVQYMITQTSDESIQISDTGFVRLRVGKSVSPMIPRIQAGDLLAHVEKSKDGYMTTDRFIVKGLVDAVKVKDDLENEMPVPESHLLPQPKIAGYQYEVDFIQGNLDPLFTPVVYKVPFDDPVWLADPHA